jgi:hypothetical protein
LRQKLFPLIQNNENPVLSLAGRWVPLFLLFAGLWLVPFRVMESDFSQVPGDMGDARFVNYCLEHGYLYLKGEVASFWDADFMYPVKNVIAFSDNMLGSMPIYALARALGFERDSAFQVWFIILFALNYLLCYFALLKWFGNPVTCAVAAFAVAFGIFNVGQIYHGQVFPRFIIPFLFYWLWSWLQSGKSRYLWLFSLGTVYQFYCGIYLGFFVLYTTLFIVVAHSLVYRNYNWFNSLADARKAVSSAAAIVLAAVLMIPLMWPYLKAAEYTGMRDYEGVFPSIPRVISYFFSTPTSIWAGWLYEHSDYAFEQWWLHHLFPGAVLWSGVLLAAVMMISRKLSSAQRRHGRFLFVAFLLSTVFCLNINESSLYRVIYEIPGFASMRALIRIINTQVVLMALLFVFGFNALVHIYPRVKTALLILPVLVVADNFFGIDYRIIRHDKQASRNQIDSVRQLIGKNMAEGKVYAVSLPDSVKGNHSKTIHHHISVMLAAQDLGVKCLNGYSGSYPENYMDFFDLTDEKTLQIYLAHMGVPRDEVLLLQWGEE